MPSLGQIVRKIAGGAAAPKPADPRAEFHSYQYLRQNQRVQEHLATLGLNLRGRRVLEVGAGIGDHTSFFLDRECPVVLIEGREENIALLRDRFRDEPLVQDIRRIDMDAPSPDPASGPADSFEVVYCFGLLYHLRRPAEAIEWMSSRCSDLLLVETWVSMDRGESLNLVEEDAGLASQALNGTGCRPTRQWCFNRLREHFPHVYMATTQPNHVRFPIDWTAAVGPAPITRSMFIASRRRVGNPMLVESIPDRQARH